MKIRITKPGIYGAKGMVPVGTETTVKEEPTRWKGRYEVISGGGEKAKTAVTNPASGSVPASYEAKHRGGGHYSVMLGDEEVVSGLDKNQAQRFNALSDEEKAEQVKGATAEG